MIKKIEKNPILQYNQATPSTTLLGLRIEKNPILQYNQAADEAGSLVSRIEKNPILQYNQAHPLPTQSQKR